MRPPIDEMRQQISAIDPTPWRAQFDDDGALVIWFHADLGSDPRRIVVSMCLADTEQPSSNELAAAGFLVNSREYVRDLIDYVLKLERVRDAARALLRNPAPRASAQSLYDAIHAVEEDVHPSTARATT